MVTIVTCTNRSHLMENIFQNYENQLLPQKELIIVLNSSSMDLSTWKKKAKKYKNVTIFKLPDKVTLGECLNYAIKRSKYEYIAKFDDDDFYAPYYLVNIMEDFKETGADLVGKRAIFCYFEGTKVLAIRTPQHENKFTNTVAGATLVFKKDVWRKIPFTKKDYKEDTTFTKELYENGYKIYSTDKYNYTCLRKTDPNHHTWNLSEEKFLKRCEVLTKTDNYKPLIIKEPSQLQKGDQ